MASSEQPSVFSVVVWRRAGRRWVRWRSFATVAASIDALRAAKARGERRLAETLTITNGSDPNKTGV